VCLRQHKKYEIQNTELFQIISARGRRVKRLRHPAIPPSRHPAIPPIRHPAIPAIPASRHPAIPPSLAQPSPSPPSPFPPFSPARTSSASQVSKPGPHCVGPGFSREQHPPPCNKSPHMNHVGAVLAAIHGSSGKSPIQMPACSMGSCTVGPLALQQVPRHESCPRGSCSALHRERRLGLATSWRPVRGRCYLLCPRCRVGHMRRIPNTKRCRRKEPHRSESGPQTRQSRL
jgi:hypothetical protein